MILVDTSVLIDWFRKEENTPAKYFDSIVEGAGWGIADLTLHEILQGASTDSEYNMLSSYLGSRKIFYTPNNKEFFKYTANIYRNLRKKGITIRSTPDTLIAGIAIHHGLTLLHNDRDFELMSRHVEGLRVVNL
jgi:predicted nucleic acid-binding protein